MEILHIRVVHRPSRFDVQQVDLPFRPQRQKTRFAAIRSNSGVTLRLAKLVSTSSAKHSGVYTSITALMKIWAGPAVGWAYLASMIDGCTREIVG